MAATNHNPSSVEHLVVPGSKRPVVGIAFFVVAAIVVAAILATVTGVMDFSAMMEDLLFTPTSTPPPFPPSAS